VRKLLIICATAALIAGCGGDGGLTEEARGQLVLHVVEVRRAAESFQPELARQKLTDFRSAVADLHKRGMIDDGQRDQLVAASVAVEARIGLAPTTTTTTTTTTTPPRVPPGQDDDDDDDDFKNPGQGKRDKAD